MINTQSTDILPNGLRSLRVGSAYNTAIACAENRWRTYRTTDVAPLAENSIEYNFLIVSFLEWADAPLRFLFDRDSCFYNRYYPHHCELLMRVRNPISVTRLVNGCLKVDGLDDVFLWVPSEEVKIWQRVCVCNTSKEGPFFKIVGVTGDDGYINSVLLTIFENRDLLKADLNREIDFYERRGGKYYLNRDLDFNGIILPQEDRI